MSAFNPKTYYQATADSGKQIIFTVAKWYCDCFVQGGVFWLRPHSAPDVSGSVPTSPIPAANAIADGWIRLTDGQKVEWGIERTTAETNAAGGLLPDQITFIDVWCETTGNLIVNSH